jgi:hypothetical protein
MVTNRVRPQDIALRRHNSKLAKKKLKEVRCQLYSDQVELVQDWCIDYSTTPTNVMRKLFNYFLHCNDNTRQKILQEY